VRRKPHSDIDAPGQDSFLDVVCNLVGILIVLVMLIAAQAKRGMVAAATATSLPAESSQAASEAEAQTAEATARAVEQSIHELQNKINRQNLEAAMRQAERDRIHVIVNVAQQRLEEYRAQLSQEEQERYDLEQQLASFKTELASLAKIPTEPNKARPHVLEHLPTPMARTVFGHEIHFRLLGHRLAYVPWEEMIERLKNDARNHLAKLKDAPRVELSLPVVAGFGARYILRRAETLIETRAGTASHTGIELELIYLVDAEPNLGQPLEQALARGSEFRSRLAACKPQNTTVTIWVYPDSFDDFRTLKAELFKMGFLTAARPMPAGEPIAGSPSGTRSSAE
jgi:biopolymer transport protein ExbD